MNKICIYIIALCSIFSCSREFGNYQKTGKNDVEQSALHGAVKKISTYNRDSVLLHVATYNEWGFYTERLDYSKGIFQDGVLQDRKCFTYDEFGNIAKKVECNEVTGVTTITSYDYDEHHNLRTEWCQVDKEITTFSTKEIQTISEKAIKTIHKYIYENGIKVKETIFNKASKSSGYREIFFDAHGNMIASCHIDSCGKKINQNSYKYDGEGNRICTILKDRNGHVTDSTVCTFTQVPIQGEYRKTTFSIYRTPYAKTDNRSSVATYNYNEYGDVDKQVIIRYNVDGTIFDRKEFVIDYVYDEAGNWVSKRMHIETTTANNRMTTDDTVGYQREIEYY